MTTWRTGRSVGRTLYRDDKLVGIVDTPELARELVEAANAASGLARVLERFNLSSIAELEEFTARLGRRLDQRQAEVERLKPRVIPEECPRCGIGIGCGGDSCKNCGWPE